MLLVVLGVSPVFAGVVDSPIPAPFTKHVFTVPGVTDNGILSSFFSCTNLDLVHVTIGVELFGNLGGSSLSDVVGSSLTLPVGGTVLFGTNFAAGIGPVDSALGGGFGKGSARVLSTSTKIACTAFVADRWNAEPIIGWQLTIIAKTKQKAAN